MRNEKISIIVPIYNVEKYLKRCLDSIIEQTYTNLEIILIDDGSRDNSGNICDEYAKCDSRIKVMHKQNGGVSSSRNAGLSLATGCFIGFVDPDDYISKDMYTILYDELAKNDADISMCGYKSFSDEKTTFQTSSSTDMYTNIEAIKKLVFDNVFTSHLWNKLYKRELFIDLKFPENRSIYEDVSVIYKLFDRAKKIVYNKSVQYGYFQRQESLVGRISEKKMLDSIDAVNERYAYLADKYPEHENIFYVSRVFSSLIFNFVLARDKNIKLYNSEFMLKEYNENITVKLSFINKIKLKYLAALILLKINRKLFYKVFSR